MSKETLLSSWCDLNPDRVWRAPTPSSENDENVLRMVENVLAEDTPMMRLGQDTSCLLLAEPSGSSANVFAPPPPPMANRRRQPVLEEQLLMNLQNVSIFSNDPALASLGVGPTTVSRNHWQPKSASFGTASTNGFTGSSETSSRRNVNKSQTHNYRTSHHHHSHHAVSNAPAPATMPSRTVHLRAGADEHRPGMRDLPYWLKKLRLHKYAPLFQDMTYQQLLSLTEASLEKMRVTNGARKKIAQSIEKLHERPALLRSLEQKLKNGTQCVRCAICSVRQLLWSPFIKYDHRKTSADIIDGFNVPSQMIADDNLPALIFRVIETLNQMIFPLRKGLLDLEDEYQLTMFHMFESVMKNESFTPNQQRKAFAMKKNARNYANPEEIRRHRMGMVSSAQCEGCHHAEVVNRERLMEYQDRQTALARGESVGEPSLSVCSALLDLSQPVQNARLEFNIPAVTPAQRIQKRPAMVEDEEWLATSGSPKIIADAAFVDTFLLPQLHSGDFWANVDNIWRDDAKPSASYVFPEYRNPEHEKNAAAAAVIMQASIEDFESPAYKFLTMFTEKPSLPEPTSKKANSTGSGYSSSDSESSGITSYGINQVLCPPTM